MLLILFFTFISPLASGQWESDQFLFNNQNPISRPKPKKKQITINKTEARKKEKSFPIASELVESKKEITKKREPTSIENKIPITLDIKLGAIDFSSKTQMTGMQFSESSYSFNGVLTLPVHEKDEASFFYTSTTEVNTGSNARARWEDWGGSYKRTFDILEHQSDLGLLLRQQSWWRTNDNADYSLKSINGIGATGSLFIPTKGLWNSKISVQLLPFLSNEKGSLKGSSYGLDWMSYYPLSFARSLIINIGYEIVSLQGSSLDLNQNLIKVSVGYRLSNSR